MPPLDDLLRLVGFLIGAIPIGFARSEGLSTRWRNLADRRRAKPPCETQIRAKLNLTLMHESFGRWRTIAARGEFA